MKSEERMVRVERRGDRYVEVFPNGRTRPLQTGKTDWSRLEAMTDEEIDAAAGADPDAQPLTDAQLKRMRRVPLAKHLRWKLGLSQAEFAERFHIPLGTLRDWEQHRSEPDQPARAYGSASGKTHRRARGSPATGCPGSGSKIHALDCTTMRISAPISAPIREFVT